MSINNNAILSDLINMQFKTFTITASALLDCLLYLEKALCVSLTERVGLQ